MRARIVVQLRGWMQLRLQRIVDPAGSAGPWRWLAAIGNAAAGAAGRHGLAVSGTLAVALAVVAAGWGPPLAWPARPR